jgi:hypothetical protein
MPRKDCQFEEVWPEESPNRSHLEELIYFEGLETYELDRLDREDEQRMSSEECEEETIND